MRDGLERLAAKWPTPMTADATRKGTFKRGNSTLSEAASLWPTPTVARNFNHEIDGKRGVGLYGIASRWPTPLASEGTHGGPSRTIGSKGDLGLSALAARWPTPTANEATGYMSGTSSDTWRPTLKGAALGMRPTRGRPDPTTQKRGPTGLVLNPQFVEALMGWPIGWTDCGSSETESSHKTQPSPSEPSRKGPRVLVGPLPIKRAIPFVKKVHRRLPKVQGAMWSVAAKIGGKIVGVALVAHPVARKAAKEWSRARVPLEVTRVAVLEGAKNACSALYAACARAARGMGASDLWTSVHSDESGHSLRAAGWVCLGECGGGEWSREGRERGKAADVLPKIKWAVPWGELAAKARKAASVALGASDSSDGDKAALAEPRERRAP